MMRDSAHIASVGRAVLAVHLFLSPLIFWRATSDVFEANKAALLCVTAWLLCALAVTTYVFGSHRIRQFQLRDPLTIALWLLVASAIISTIYSISPRTSFWGAVESNAGLTTVLGYALLFVTTCFFCRNSAELRHLLGFAVAAAGVASTYAIVQACGADPFDWKDRSSVAGLDRPFGTFGHPNLLAAYLVMVVPLAVEFARQAATDRHWLKCAANAIVCVLAITAVGTSLSRSAWFALAVTASIMWCGWVLIRRRRALVGMALVGTVALVVGFAGIAKFAADTSLFERISQLGDFGSRGFLWRAGWEMFCEHPLVGWGLDAYQLAFAGKRTPAYWAVEWNATPAKAHNEIIHVLATQGALGMAALLGLACAIVWAVVRAWKYGDPSERPLMIAIVAGIVGFGVQNLFGFTAVGIGVLFVTLTAMLSRFADLSHQPEAQAPRGWSTRRLSLGLVNPALEPTMKCTHDSPQRSPFTWLLSGGAWSAAVIGIFYLAICPTKARVQTATGERLLPQDPLTAIRFTEEAVALEPGRDLHWTKLSIAAQTASQSVPASKDRRRLLERAHEAFAEAARLVPVSGYHHANLGRVLAALARDRLDSPEDAFLAYDRALAIDPNNAYFYADAGNAALVLAQWDRASFYASEGLARYPEFAPLRAIQGYVALQEGKLHDAARLIAKAICSEWHGDAAGHYFATQVLNNVYDRLPGRKSEVSGRKVAPDR